MLTFHIKFRVPLEAVESLVGVLFDEGSKPYGGRVRTPRLRLYRVCRSGRSGLEVTPSPSQGEMLADALFEALVHVLANANASLKVASTRRK
jgi:hypothetical protein